MNPAAGLRYRAWHRVPVSTQHVSMSAQQAPMSSAPIAWQVGTERDNLLILVDSQASALRTLAKQLPAQTWSGLVLPGPIPLHPEFTLFFAQLGRPPILGVDTMQDRKR
jgi:hypothetical protein